LADAIPDLERRDTIVIAGNALGQDWVGCGGYYTGLFERPWLKIPPTRHQISLRFHEFYRMEEGRVIEMQALWDIPEVMMQARAWPMAPVLAENGMYRDRLRRMAWSPRHMTKSRLQRACNWCQT
jgi:hypothetical protein